MKPLLGPLVIFLLFFNEIQISSSMFRPISLKSKSKKQEDDRLATVATPRLRAEEKVPKQRCLSQKDVEDLTLGRIARSEIVLREPPRKLPPEKRSSKQGRKSLEDIQHRTLSRIALLEEQTMHASHGSPPQKRGHLSEQSLPEEMHYRTLVRKNRAEKLVQHSPPEASAPTKHQIAIQERGQGLEYHNFQRQVHPLGGNPAEGQYPPQFYGQHQQTAHSSWNPNTNFQNSEYESYGFQNLNQQHHYGDTGPSGLYPFETSAGHNQNQGVHSGGYGVPSRKNTNFHDFVNPQPGFGIVDDSQLHLTNGPLQAYPEETSPSNSAAVDHSHQFYASQGHVSTSGSGYGSGYDYGYGHNK